MKKVVLITRGLMLQMRSLKRAFSSMIAILLVLTFAIHPVFTEPIRIRRVEIGVRSGFVVMTLAKRNWGTLQDLANPLNTEWLVILPPTPLPILRTLTTWIDNGDGLLSSGDQIKLSPGLIEQWEVERVQRELISEHFVIKERGLVVTDADLDRAINTFEQALSVFREGYGFRNPEPIADGGGLSVWVGLCDTGCAWKYFGIGGWEFWIEIPPDVFSWIRNEHIMLHELFHEVQYAYPGGSEVVGLEYADWVTDGQARMMQDKTFLDLDLWDGSGEGTYLGEVQSYLSNTEVTLGDLSYMACLFWTYFTEQVGLWRAEPGYGMDALVNFWSHASDNYGGFVTIKKVLQDLKPEWDFETLWKCFIVANYMKNIIPHGAHQMYKDEEQYLANVGHAPFWDGWNWHWPSVHFTVDETLSAYGSIEKDAHINKWAAHYNRIAPSADVDLVNVHFWSDRDLYYRMIAVKGGTCKGEWWYTGNNFEETIANHDYDEIVVVVGGLNSESDYSYTVKALTPMIRICGPIAEDPAIVGGDPPTENFWLDVRVEDQAGYPIDGLNEGWMNTGYFPPDFDITVGLPGGPKVPATPLFVTATPTLAQAPVRTHRVLVQPPGLSQWRYDVHDVQLYDLNVGLGDVVATEQGALDYGTGEPELPQIQMNLIATPLLLPPPENEEGTGLKGDFASLRVSLLEWVPITGANVTAEIETPPLFTPDAILPSETYYIHLYDDGEHEDNIAGDGIYGNIFYKTQRLGTYNIEASAEGFAPEFGSFTRNITGSFTVMPSVDSDGDGLPSWWEERMGLNSEDPEGDQGAAGDPDMDGLNNACEFTLGISPIDSDTDNGGESDGSEFEAGRDPNDSGDDTISYILDFDVMPRNGYNLVVCSPLPEYERLLIWRSTNPEIGYEPIAEGVFPKGIFNDTSVENGVTYYYKIAAKGPGGQMTRIELPESATPKTDVNPPLGFISINDGAGTTDSVDVRLTLRSCPDTTHMMISNDPRFTDAQWEPYQTSKDWRLKGSGLQTVYVRFRDASDNIAVEKHASIIVLMPVHAYVDVKPGSWPNPLQLNEKGVLPIAICGTEDFDVTTIDPETIRLTLEGTGVSVAPLRWNLEDAATPYIGEPYGGHELGPDGYLDLTLKFQTQEVIQALGLNAFSNKDEVILTLAGNHKEENGGKIQGQDWVVILKK